MKTYLVGGAVRDLLMGGSPQDRDWVVVGGTENAMFIDGFEKVGAEFPVFLHPETREEYALARREKSTGPGYHGFSVEFGADVTLDEDLKRRDLTINAMAMSTDGEVHDSYGGKADLEKGVLRHVDESAFGDDPVRVLRLARFAARFPSFTIAPDTVDLVYSVGKSGALGDLTPERVYKELSRALMETEPRRFFDTLLECDVLHILFPEVYGLVSAPEWRRHHPEGNAYEHTMLVMTAMKNLPEYDLSDMVNALCHDLGKAVSPRETLPRHLGHEQVGVDIVLNFLTRMKAPTQIKSYATRTCRYHMYMHKVSQMISSEKSDLQPKTVCKMFDAAIRGCPDFPEKLIRIGKADERGRLGNEQADVTHMDVIHGLFEAYSAPSFAEVIGERDLAGIVIKSEMYQARVRSVKQLMRSLHQRPEQQGSKP